MVKSVWDAKRVESCAVRASEMAGADMILLVGSDDVRGVIHEALEVCCVVMRACQGE